MKLLFLTPQLPYPPHQGTTIRNYNLIRSVAAQHTVHLFSFSVPGEGLQPDNPLYSLCARIEIVPQPLRSMRQRGLQTVLSTRPDMGLRLESPEAHRSVRNLVQQESYDLVQAEGIEMAAYALHAHHSPNHRPLPHRPRLVFDDHNAEYLLQKRAAQIDLRRPRRWLAAAYSLVQWRKLRRYEQWLCSQMDAVIAVSEPDRQALRHLDPKLDPLVIPNGIDVEHYRPLSSQNAVHKPVLVFTGKMDYRPNVDAVLWFVQHVLPLIRLQRPDVCFQIVGKSPHPRIAHLAQHPNIQITGAVDEIRPYIQQAAVYVAPLRVGGGTRFKVLEAMACGKALVSTSLGVEGIGVTHGHNLLLADKPSDFASAVLTLLRDQQESGALTANLGRAARTFVESNYAWEQLLPPLLSLYNCLRN